MTFLLRPRDVLTTRRITCTPKLRQLEALHFAAKGLQSAEEEKERVVYAGVPAVCRRTNESSNQYLRLDQGIGGPACTPSCLNLGVQSNGLHFSARRGSPSGFSMTEHGLGCVMSFVVSSIHVLRL